MHLFSVFLFFCVWPELNCIYYSKCENEKCTYSYISDENTRIVWCSNGAYSRIPCIHSQLWIFRLETCITHNSTKVIGSRRMVAQNVVHFFFIFIVRRSVEIGMKNSFHFLSTATDGLMIVPQEKRYDEEKWICTSVDRLVNFIFSIWWFTQKKVR